MINSIIKISIYLIAYFIISINSIYAQNTIDEAVGIINQISHPDKHIQDRMRAHKAFEIVRARVEVLNDFSGTFLQTLPVDFWNYFSGDGNFKTRAEVISAARAKGWDLGQVAWLIKGGQCDEHASLMKHLLNKVGITNVKIIRSNSPHAFPLVNALPDFDPDNPWTWGKNAFVPDSWAGALLNPLDLWYENHYNLTSIYFKEGEYSVNIGKLTNREKLAEFVKRGRSFILKHCDEYNQLIKRFLIYPPEVRAKLSLKPPLDICKGISKSKLVFLENSFEIYDLASRQYKKGKVGKTTTSSWTIDKDYFKFNSKKDTFSLEIYWDQLPKEWHVNEPFPFEISTSILGGPREVNVFVSPVMDMTGWDIQQLDSVDYIRKNGVNMFVKNFDNKSVDNDSEILTKKMTLSIKPIGRGASIKNQNVVNGSDKFYRGKKPGEYDVYFLQLNCNNTAKIIWTYVPEGSPHLNKNSYKSN